MQLVIFNTPKEGYRPAEWEDGGAGYDSGGSVARFAVADGATEGYESRRWVRQLLGSFLATGRTSTPPGPELEQRSLGLWLARMQDDWSRSVPETADYVDLMKIRQGSFATFVGCQLEGLDGRTTPRWNAVAVGDAVLFHVRGLRQIGQLPKMSAADFGTAPDGLSTLPERLAGTIERLRFGSGGLEPGDLLFAATDAIAKWMLTWVEKDEESLWHALETLANPDEFDRLVSDHRQSRAMKDDDVTLLRARLLAKPADRLVMFR
jgi:hypothetical protein